MTTTHLLSEKMLPGKTPQATEMNPKNPPTYAESVASEPSPVQPIISRQASSTSQHNIAAADQQPSQLGKKRSSRFSQHLSSVSSKVGWPLNKAANVVGAEGWWPTSVEKECDKAARILHSFTSLEPSNLPSTDAPVHPLGITRKSMVTIPPAVLARCAGLAIFNVLRAGTFHGSLAGGSGLVVARLPSGCWSAPSSFVVSTVGVGLAVGLDMYDCVCVLNTPAQVAAFTKPRVSLGGAASVAVGPVGTGGSLDAALSRTARPMWSYMKSRGLWAGVQVDGTVMVTRGDANAVFYGERAAAGRILQGEVPWPEGKGAALQEVLRAVDGRQDGNLGMAREVVSDKLQDEDVYADEKAAVEVASQEAQYETAEEEKARLAREEH
ncbi:DUF500 domain protein [Akanthomyces lecanii RCEF 1005]|uniref:DUF500 domain protein n=1 Tax=Akanthomyces lecanii RCEF 1005 TaxID=1081108 RepID=A0A168JIQ8_CORDF|nr:DUF500 domain protein [Akanthomyces lecanii RCEF 1005]